MLENHHCVAIVTKGTNRRRADLRSIRHGRLSQTRRGVANVFAPHIGCSSKLFIRASRGKRGPIAATAHTKRGKPKVTGNSYEFVTNRVQPRRPFACGVQTTVFQPCGDRTEKKEARPRATPAGGDVNRRKESLDAPKRAPSPRARCGFVEAAAALRAALGHASPWYRETGILLSGVNF